MDQYVATDQVLQGGSELIATIGFKTWIEDDKPGATKWWDLNKGKIISRYGHLTSFVFYSLLIMELLYQHFLPLDNSDNW